LLTSPYSIYVNKRPLRVAFLMEDKAEAMDSIDSVLAYNRDRWGGRYNPLILTDGRTIPDSWWSFLESIDPDIVHSLVPLSEELIGLIDRRIAPYLLRHPGRPEAAEPPSRHLHLDDEGLSLLPTPMNVRMASWAIGESSLVLFDTHWQRTEPLLKRFIEWNFGGYSPPSQAVTRALEAVRTQPYTITDVGSLVAPLTELSAFRAFTYPIQLCSVPKESLPNVRYDRYGETFHVIVGDSPRDVAYFWNRPAALPLWSRTHLNQLWLPIAIATDPLLRTALVAWLQHAADPGGNSQGSIRFVSFSLSESQLLEIVEPLAQGIRAFRSSAILSEMPAPDVAEGPPGPRGQSSMDLYRATGTVERLTLLEPDLPQGPSQGECWMADVYVEFRPERYPNIIGRDVWWQLPRMNELAWHIFRRPSRILRTRYPSVLMKRGDRRLDVALPDDIAIFAQLATLRNGPYYTVDARHDQSDPGHGRVPFQSARRSEKGRYLSGLLDLFDGLFEASNTLEERYWRRMFNLLCGRTGEKDSALLERVKNKLRKQLGANRAGFYENDKSMDWLTEYVVDVARGLPMASRELEFRDFDENARTELADFNARQTGEAWVYSAADTVTALSSLTERGVLLLGFQARCPACGYRAWHHIDDVKQAMRCGGCNAVFPLPPEQRWHYRLNTLVRAAYGEHGLLPVVLVLGQLLMDARTSFMFAPCLDVFEDGEKGPFGDLDIAAIVDGRFVVGEVKQSRGLFDEATFTKMESIAKRLLPDELLFASMDREPSPLIAAQIAQLSARLRPVGVAVRWYQLHADKFGPSPVR
jgi:hypothetical protein